MKSFILAALIGASLSVFAANTNQQRYVFEFTDKAGTIKKLQVDLSENKGKWIADTKSLAADGRKEPAQLPCTKISADEFKCQRDDNGGGFDLLLGATPKITVTYFCADEEGADVKTAIRGTKDAPVVVEGKKAALSRQDAI